MEELFKKTADFKYSSLKYLNLEEFQTILPEDIIIDKPGVFALCRYIDHRHNIFWAADSEQAFMNTLLELTSRLTQLHTDGLETIYIEFIHPDFIPAMEAIGFTVVSDFIDFWNENILTSVTSASVVGSSISIRNIELHEYKQASLITQACKEVSRGFYGEELEFIQEWNEADHSCVLVAELHKEVVGVCLLNIYGFESDNGPILWLRQLAVDPNYHNKGIGTLLITKGLRWGVTNGAKQSFLAVDRENKNAIKIYNKSGYTYNDTLGQINMAFVQKVGLH